MSAIDIFTASANGDIAAIQAALNDGVFVNSLSMGGQTPLHFAVVYGQLEAAEFLIMRGADVNLPNHIMSQKTPLMSAVENGNLPLVQLLLRQKADFQARDSHGTQAIHLSTRSPEILKLLIDHKADVNAQTNSGLTPLRFAAVLNNIDSVKILLAANADPTPARGATANEEINKLLDDKIKQSQAKRPKPS